MATPEPIRTSPGPASLQELRTRPMVFVDDIERPELADGDRNHLERSLRIRPGAVITVSDGAGRWRAARLGPTVEVDGEVALEARSGRPVAIGFAPVKGDRSDLIVQKLTELGIEEIVPLLAERSVVRWDGDRAEKNRHRHLRIAREAAMQSRNPWLPTVGTVITVGDFLTAGSTLGGAGGSGGAVVADPGGRYFDGLAAKVAIGPEGGFSPAELAGRDVVALPGRVLRTETAAITAAVLAVAARQRG